LSIVDNELSQESC